MLDRRSDAMRAVPIALIMLAMLSAAPRAWCADDLFAQNAFEVVPTRYDTMTQVYDAAHEGNRPIIVTTDSVLHTSHLMFDYLLRVAEVEHLQRDLIGLTDAMAGYLERTRRELPAAGCGRCVVGLDAAEDASSFFAVASELLGTVEFADRPAPPAAVTDELKLIEAHAGFAKSPLFGYDEDYSQYVPRGHYTRKETLQRYFRAMMWYGRMSFPVSGPRLSEDRIRRYTADALVIVTALQNAKVGDEPALDVWRRIYETTALFAGQSDDLTVDDYLAFAPKQIPGHFDNDDLDRIIAEIRKLRKPGIIGTLVPDEPAPAEAPMGFRFMGQRFIPDSYIFQQLVYDKVGTREKPRLMPKGLDVLEVLGESLTLAMPPAAPYRARQLLQAQGDFDYLHYGEQLNKLTEEFAKLPPEQWQHNLYWRWLSCLRTPLPSTAAAAAGRGDMEPVPPVIIYTTPYADKMLMTLLGSWAELRHDTILYAKQSYTVGVTALRPQPVMTRGYVEPYPDLYACVRGLVAAMREALDRRGVLPAQVRANLTSFEELLARLEAISRKETQWRPPDDADCELIWNIGPTLDRIATLPPEIMENIADETDEKMALVADVHTDPNSGQVLQVAVGRPYLLRVNIPQPGGGTAVAEGPVFSYYEFTHPMSDRLTDERWQEMIAKGAQPPLPEWTKSFVVEDRPPRRGPGSAPVR
jgi:hypothetical protein